MIICTLCKTCTLKRGLGSSELVEEAGAILLDSLAPPHFDGSDRRTSHKKLGGKSIASHVTSRFDVQTLALLHTVMLPACQIP